MRTALSPEQAEKIGTKIAEGKKNAPTRPHPTRRPRRAQDGRDGRGCDGIAGQHIGLLPETGRAGQRNRPDPGQVRGVVGEGAQRRGQPRGVWSSVAGVVSPVSRGRVSPPMGARTSPE
jgi:hypothetical protein